MSVPMFTPGGGYTQAPAYNLAPVVHFQQEAPPAQEVRGNSKKRSWNLLPDSSPSDSDGDEEEGRLAKKSFVLSEKYIDLDFNACFFEHKSTSTITPVYKVYGYVFEYTKLIIYNILVFVLGVPFAVFWGIIFSLVSFILTWIWNPVLKLSLLLIGVTMPSVTEPLKALFGPLVDVQARIFRQIHINWKPSGKLPAQSV